MARKNTTTRTAPRKARKLANDATTPTTAETTAPKGGKGERGAQTIVDSIGSIGKPLTVALWNASDAEFAAVSDMLARIADARLSASTTDTSLVREGTDLPFVRAANAFLGKVLAGRGTADRMRADKTVASALFSTFTPTK